MTPATVVQVLQDLFYVLLQLLVVILSFKFYCMFYCMFYFTCDRSFTATSTHATHPSPPVPTSPVTNKPLASFHHRNSYSRRQSEPLYSVTEVESQETINMAAGRL